MQREDLKAVKEALRIEVRNIMANYLGGRDAESRGGRDPDAVGLGEFRAISVAAYLLLQESEALRRLTRWLILLTIFLTMLAALQVVVLLRP